MGGRNKKKIEKKIAMKISRRSFVERKENKFIDIIYTHTL